MRTLFVALVFALSAVAAPDTRKPATDDAADIAEKLTERIDMDRIDNVSFRVAMEVLQEKIGYSIVVDYRGFGRTDEPDSRREFDERQVSLGSMKRIRIETILRQILDQIDADFLIAPDHVFITTRSIKAIACGSNRTLRELDSRCTTVADTVEDTRIEIRHTAYVTMRFRDMPIAEALSAVATRTGRTITLAADAADKRRTPVSLALTNAPFETAVANLAEAAGLRAYRHGNSVVVVSAARAKTIDTVPEFQGAGGCCSLGSGRTVTLDELESIARLFAGARPADATTSKVGALTKDLETKQIDISRLQTGKDELEEKIRKLTEEVEKLRNK